MSKTLLFPAANVKSRPVAGYTINFYGLRVHVRATQQGVIDLLRMYDKTRGAK